MRAHDGLDFACFAAVAAGLSNPVRYWPFVVEVLCLVQLLYALRLAMQAPSERNFPFVAFVFTGVYLMITRHELDWNPTRAILVRVQDLLHPVADVAVLAEWLLLFDAVGKYGIAMLGATLVYLASSTLCQKKDRQVGGE